MSSEEEGGHIRFLQEGDSTVLSEEGKEEVSFIETHPGFSNMADNEVESLQEDIEQQPKQQGDNSKEDDDDDKDEDEEDQEARNAQALEDAENEHLANILQAKSLVKLIPKSFKRTCANVSVIWKKWFCIPEMNNPNLEADLKRLDPLVYDMLLESRKPDVYMYACKLCYDTPTTSLNQCFKGNSSSGGPGNLPNHLMTLHKEAYEEYNGKSMSAKKEKRRYVFQAVISLTMQLPPKKPDRNPLRSAQELLP
jgi:hypothetical protein